jgi:uncharacterized lipoprotein YbaY
VTGRIVFGEDPPVFTGARVSIRLEDTTYADAPARPIAERVMEPVAYDGDATGIPFSLDVPAATGPVRMTLQVLVDLDGDGKATRGDYINMVAVPVPPGTAAEEIEVPVRRIR